MQTHSTSPNVRLLVRPTENPSTAQVEKIVARARYLHERTEEMDPTADGCAEQDEKLVAQEKRWRRAVGQGDDRAYRRRLKWAGLCSADIPQIARDAPTSGATLPLWAQTMLEVMTEAKAARERIAKYPSPVPFAMLYQPMVAVARRRLLRRLELDSTDALVSGPSSWMSTEAYQQLEMQLSRRLLSRTGRALLEDFDRSVGFGAALIRRVERAAEPGAEEGNTRYAAWVDGHLRGGLTQIFTTYPLVGRHIAVLVDQWVDTTTEFLGRLSRDRAAIAAIIGGCPSLGRIEGLSVGLSDPHDNGRTVSIVRFENGARIVYKPHDLELEAAHSAFAEWCNARSDLDLRAPRVVTKEGYGWVEHVEHRHCSDRSAGALFYRRVGARLCIAYLLGGTDYHSENLISTGADLVPIDNETILYPEPVAMSEQWHAPTFDSVLSTGMLPVWSGSADGSAQDVSGISGGTVTPAVQMTWTGVGTDAIDLIEITPQSYQHDNGLHLADGRRLAPVDYLEAIDDGFHECYRIVLDEREEVLGSNGPLSKFAGHLSRFVFRPTRIYDKLLGLSAAPGLLRSGLAWSLEFEQLAYAYCLASERPSTWPVFLEELAALHRFDVPRFVAKTDERTLQLADGSSVYGLRRSGLTRTRTRIEAMSGSDLRRQSEVVRAAFLSQNVGGAELAQATVITSAAGDNSAEEADKMPALTADEALVEARALGDLLETLAIHSDEQVGWLGLHLDKQQERFSIAPIGSGLFDGCGGVLVFLATLDAVEGRQRYRELIARGAATISEPVRLHGDSRVVANDELPRQLGGSDGLGSLIYCLVRLAELSGDSRLLDHAETAARAIRPRDIEADDCFDILAGCAGALLGLLSLHERRPSRWVAARARACGQHLLHHRVRYRGSPRAWQPGFADRPLTGFSHGAAGISYALLRLFELTGEVEFRDAAREGQAFERSVFCGSTGNWPDLRPGRGEGHFRQAWCVGGPGVALARLGGLAIDDTPEARAEIEAGLRVTRNATMLDVDHVCCGNFGRISVLLEAAASLGDAGAAVAAASRARWALTRAAERGSFQLQWYVRAGNSFRNPGFFQGLAGIGYQLLRIARPDAVRSVLLWR